MTSTAVIFFCVAEGFTEPFFHCLVSFCITKILTHPIRTSTMLRFAIFARTAPLSSMRRCRSSLRCIAPLSSSAASVTGNGTSRFLRRYNNHAHIQIPTSPPSPVVVPRCVPSLPPVVVPSTTTTSMTMVIATRRRRAHCGCGAMMLGVTPVLRMRFMPTTPMLGGGGGGRHRVAVKTSSSTSAATMTKTCGYTQESLKADLEKYNAMLPDSGVATPRATSIFNQVSIPIFTRVLLVSHCRLPCFLSDTHLYHLFPFFSHRHSSSAAKSGPSAITATASSPTTAPRRTPRRSR